MRSGAIVLWTLRGPALYDSLLIIVALYTVYRIKNLIKQID